MPGGEISIPKGQEPNPFAGKTVILFLKSDILSNAGMPLYMNSRSSGMSGMRAETVILGWLKAGIIIREGCFIPWSDVAAISPAEGGV